jgi:AcrR family transcriptional regulator
MPTDTFHRLAEEKKQRIFQAAVREFADRRFSEASINQIIKKAAIPRGSFYQYFAGKEELYLYVLQEISKAKLDIYKGFTAAAPEMSFFEVLDQAIPAIFTWADKQNDYNKIGLRMFQEDSAFMGEIIGKMRDSMDIMFKIIKEDQAKGRIRQDVEAATVLELLQIIAGALLRDYFGAGQQDAVQDKIRDYFDILFRGLLPKQKEDDQS